MYNCKCLKPGFHMAINHQDWGVECKEVGRLGREVGEAEGGEKDEEEEKFSPMIHSWAVVISFSSQ